MSATQTVTARPVDLRDRPAGVSALAPPSREQALINFFFERRRTIADVLDFAQDLLDADLAEESAAEWAAIEQRRALASVLRRIHGLDDADLLRLGVAE